VGGAVRNWGIPHLTPTLSAPEGGEDEISAMGRAAMVADNPQHRLAVLGKTGEGAELACHLG
jgi:hypothetical protein